MIYLAKLTACFFLLGLFSFNNVVPETALSNSSEPESEKFVENLDKLGYFKYADKNNVKKLKDIMIEEWDPNSELSSIWDEKGMPLDFRYYYCDGEILFEEGGIIDMLNDLKPTFQKIGFTCKISSHFEKWDEANKSLDHRITINDTEYVIFKDFKGTGWQESAFRLAEILNTELEKQNIDERIYLVSSGNDGRLIFLTDELYQYIYSVYKNRSWKPLAINEWAKAMRKQ
jgi:hypothetical protein